MEKNDDNSKGLNEDEQILLVEEDKNAENSQNLDSKKEGNESKEENDEFHDAKEEEGGQKIIDLAELDK